MWAGRRLVCLLLSLAVAGLAVTPASAAQTVAARPAEPARKRPAAPIDHAAALLQIQTVLGRMAVSSELVPADAEELGRALVVVRGRAIEDPALKAFTVRLALAMADGAFDDEGLERLAQDLYAAVNSRALTPREASLLAADVETLLRDAGTASDSIDAASAALAGLGLPGVAAPRPEQPASPRLGGLQVLTRQ